MSNDIKNNLIACLQKKHAALNELLRVTNLVTLTGQEDKFEEEASEYIFLIEKREHLFKEIEILNHNLKVLNKKSYNIASDEIKDLEHDIHKLVQIIIEVDIKNIEISNQIFFKLKNSIKNINIGKNVNSAYQSDFGMLTGTLVDKSN